MKSIQIKDSYDVWLPRDQQWYANQESYLHYAEKNASFALRRSWLSIHIEWWLHNIGYYITKPFCFVDYFNKIKIVFYDEVRISCFAIRPLLFFP